MEKYDTCKKSVLSNGLTVVSQADSAFYSAVVGIWVKNGSRDEDASQSGISHFIEHMLFKGTATRSPQDIAREIESVGGELNAFTTRESTCYYVKVLKDHLPRAMDLLCDIFLNSTFDEGELEKEREVILQEISMVDDTPDDHVHDLLNKTFWPGSALGRPVLGCAGNIARFGRKDLLQFMGQAYLPHRIVVAAAGNINHEKLVEEMEASLGALSGGISSGSRVAPAAAADVAIVRKDLEQVHLCVGTKGISDADEKRYAGYILNTILGDGMGSRLFQEIRENRGLAYSVYSYLSPYADCGMLGIYAGTGPQHVPDVLDQIAVELMRLKTDVISVDELTAAREQLKGNMILGLESSESRMQRLAHNELSYGRHISTEETIREIDSVTAEAVLALSRALFSAETLSLALIGDFDESAVRQKVTAMKKRLTSAK